MRSNAKRPNRSQSTTELVLGAIPAATIPAEKLTSRPSLVPSTPRVFLGNSASVVSMRPPVLRDLVPLIADAPFPDP
jgi:hypothetical protein